MVLKGIDMCRRAFTVIEVLVLLIIVAVAVVLSLSFIQETRRAAGPPSNYYQKRETFIAKLVNARDVVILNSEETIVRADISRAQVSFSSMPSTSKELTPSGVVEVLDNRNDPNIPKHDAETIQVNFVKDAWYQFEVIGYKIDGGYYPNIIRMTRIPDPPPVAEIDTLP